ncbi:MAG: DUF2306 domain-containing protein [Kofleriaceae bacterium]|nr:DUF2306 domain-containing protein [Kofleriaceae bacterium]
MRFFRYVVVLVLAMGSAAITNASRVYFDADEYAPFVMEKLDLPLPNEDRYILLLQLHVIAAAFALPACLLLLSRTLMKRAPSVHRWLGRLTGAVAVLALAPSGFYLSLYAKGGLLGTLGFMLSGAIVVVAMVQAVRAARAGKYAAHRRFVLHVLAQMAVAVVSRAMLFAADAAGFDHDTAYLVSLWLPVLGCAALVEWLAGPRHVSWRNHASLSSRRRHHRPHVEPGFGRI